MNRTYSKSKCVTHRTSEPMEIDHSRGHRFMPRNRFNRVSTVNGGSNRSIRCRHCGLEGHVIRECKVKEQGNRPAMGHGRSRTNEARRPGLQEN